MSADLLNTCIEGLQWKQQAGKVRQLLVYAKLYSEVRQTGKGVLGNTCADLIVVEDAPMLIRVHLGASVPGLRWK